MSDKALVFVGENHDHICVNYMNFLSASCKKRWRFFDAIYGVIPILGMVTRTPNNIQFTPTECLKELALQIISTQVSDETNIVRLITLAEQQKIWRLDILLPYMLSEQQIGVIQQEYSKPIALIQHNDQLSIYLQSKEYDIEWN